MIPKPSEAKLAIYCLGFLIFSTLTLMVNEKSHGYIMPAEQLIGFMTSNFSNFKTLVIIQSNQQGNQGHENPETVFKEQIWMKSPNLFHSKVLDQDVSRSEVPDITYRQLLIANKKDNIERLLSRMGINLQSVAFTRIDGIIAYRIGDKGSESPKKNRSV